jgi:RNA polymerase sigma factor (sigma-70 family)
MRKVELERIIDDYGRQLSYVALQILGDRHDASDAVSEALVRVMSRIAKITTRKHACNSLFQALRHAAIDILRKRRRRDEVETPVENPEESFIERSQPPSETLLVLDEAIGLQLRGKGRLREYAGLMRLGLTTEEIAKRLAMTLPSAERCERRVLKALQGGVSAA